MAYAEVVALRAFVSLGWLSWCCSCCWGGMNDSFDFGVSIVVLFC